MGDRQLRIRAHAPASLASAVFVALSCGGESTAPPVTPGSVSAVTPINVSGVVGERVVPSPRVLVRDVEGAALSGAAVTFRVASASGLVAGTGPPSEAVTVSSDASGHAEVIWTLGTGAGRQIMSAEVAGTAPVFFSAFVSPGAPTVVIPLSATDQAEPAGGDVSEPLTVVVNDRYGNPVPGVSIEWTAPAASIATYSTTDSLGMSSLAMRVAWNGGGSMFARVSGLPAVEFRMVGLIVTSDPLDDRYVTSASAGFEPPDIWWFGAAADTGRGDMVVQLVFKDTVARASEGGPRALAGWVDLDVDQSSNGAEGKADALRPPGWAPSGLGVEFSVSLTPDATGKLPIVFTFSGEVVGHATPRFAGTRVMIRVPLAVLWNDEGLMNLVAIAGTPAEMTDVVPNDGWLGVAIVGGS